MYPSHVKSLTCKKDVGMACQKVCKQGRDDENVKVDKQSLHLLSNTTVHSSVEKVRDGMGLCIFTK